MTPFSHATAIRAGPTAGMIPPLLAEALGWVRQRLVRNPHHGWGSWLFGVLNPASAKRQLARTETALTIPGGHRLSPVSLRHVRGSERMVECWEAVDAWILKALALLLTPILGARLSRRCFHLPGRGGGKGAVRALREAIATGRYHFVARSDARGYYAGIRHSTLLEELRRHVGCPVILDLVSQYCERTVVWGGLYRRIGRTGISLGCPLSPLMAALYLSRLDSRMEAMPGVFYVRFMDDWVILAETRWRLRRAVRVMNHTLSELSLAQHPDKTFIGRLQRGFDFLGYDFSDSAAISPSRACVRRLAGNIARLYEQGAGLARIGRYTENWMRWLRAGIGVTIKLRRKDLPSADDSFTRKTCKIRGSDVEGDVRVLRWTLKANQNACNTRTHEKLHRNESEDPSSPQSKQPLEMDGGGHGLPHGGLGRECHSAESQW